MKSIFTTIVLFLITLIFPAVIHAQDATIPQQDFFKAKIIRVVSEGEKSFAGFKNSYQDLEIEITDGKEKGKKLTIQNGGEMSITPEQKVSKDAAVIVVKSFGPNGETRYQIYDKYRINTLVIIILLFFFFTVIMVGKRGLGSFGGLLVSLVIILVYIIPQITAGQNPLTVSIIGSSVILFLTTYLAHGISKQTTIALISTFIALLSTAWISTLFVDITHLTGINEETAILQFGATNIINIKGLLLSGIIIGTLGALNDITVTQAAAVFELAKTDNKLSIEKLFVKGFAIGKEHVASMVNTLVLAYAGSSLVVFIFVLLNPARIPYWVIINNELISGEIIRAAAGSLGLMLVVPIATFLSAIAVKKWK